MRPYFVEVPTPGHDDHASFGERVEDLAVEKLIAQPCVEALWSEPLGSLIASAAPRRPGCRVLVTVHRICIIGP
jgi:hypothetical protein